MLSLSMQQLKISSLNELPDLAKNLLKAAGNERFFLIKGPMGAGKTSLIKALCLELGSNDLVSSPTFSIVNEYHCPNGNIYHFDFYRIKSLQEAFDIGYEEYFYSGDYCFVEWPEIIAEILPDHYFEVKIEVLSQQERRFEFQHVSL